MTMREFSSPHLNQRLLVSKEAAVINHLPRLIASLPTPIATLWRQIYRMDVSHGVINPPERMHTWIERSFGSVDAVLQQEIIRVTNQWTLEGAIFNRIRGLRPQQGRYQSEIDQIIAANAGSHDDSGFCAPESGTPEDVFGRIRGRYCITASNVAKFDGWHGIVVFDEHHPLNFNLERVIDYIQTAERWFDAVHATDGTAQYPLYIWNCLWRSGASVIHGHAQTSVAQGMAYPKIEALRRTASLYQHHHASSYFSDIWKIHQALGLAFNASHTSVQGYASLTPVKEKEVILFGDKALHLSESLYHVLDCFVTELGVQSFNVSVIFPPLGTVADDWSSMPTIVRVVDRGDPNSRGSDIGAMELFAGAVIASDPFDVARALAGRFKN